MSALAAIAYAWGADVDGCDTAESEYTRRLERFGIHVHLGHDRGPPRRRDGRRRVLGGRGRRGGGARRARARPRRDPPGGAPRRDGRRAAVDLRRRRARQDDDHGDDRVRRHPPGPRSHLARRRRRAPARRERRPGRRRAAGRRGGRVRRLVRPAAAPDRARHQHRARPPRPVRLEQALRALFAEWVAGVPADGVVLLGDGVDLDTVAPRAWFGFDERADWRITASRGTEAARGSGCACRRRRRFAWSSAAGPAQRPERCGRRRGAGRRRCERCGCRRGAARVRGRGPPVRAAWRGGGCRDRRRLRAPSDRGRGRDRRGPRAVACARRRRLPAAPLLPDCCAGATGSARRSPAPTRPSSPRSTPRANNPSRG